MPLGPLAAPLAALYGAAVLARRGAYDRGWLRVSRTPLFTVSVGGLEAGGSGKTPVTGLLLGALAASGRSVGLLTRGYGRRSRGLVVRSPGGAALPEAIGDEPAMLVAAGHDLPVAACAARVEGARALVGAGCDCAVLDDAFSHRALARDVDIVVLRGEAPFGNGHLLPWGTLREPPSSLARADLVWLHFRGAAEPPPRAFAGRALVVSESVPGPVTDGVTGGPRDLSGRRVLVAAGIAHPSDLADSVAALGGDVVEQLGFRDHHPFSSADAERMAGRAFGADAVAVTAKDAVKLSRHWRSTVPLWVVGQRVVIRRGAAALAEILGIPKETLASTLCPKPSNNPVSDPITTRERRWT